MGAYVSLQLFVRRLCRGVWRAIAVYGDVRELLARGSTYAHITHTSAHAGTPAHITHASAHAGTPAHVACTPAQSSMCAG